MSAQVEPRTNGGDGPIDRRLHDRIGPIVWDRALAIAEGREHDRPTSIACTRVGEDRIEITRTVMHDRPWTTILYHQHIDGIDRIHIRADSRGHAMLTVLML